MARLVGCLRRTIISCSSSSIPYENPRRTSIWLNQNRKYLLSPRYMSSQNYVSEMRKSAFEGNILRLIRNEIQYEHDHSPPLQPVTGFGPFTVDERPGEQWISLKRKFREEEIKVEATMFDGSIPISKSSVGVPEDVQLHITIVVNISKGDGEVLEFMCSAWPDTIEISNLFVRSHGKHSAHPYIGPEFKELDDQLQHSLYEFLEERGISDDLAVFLHQYMKNKDKTEYVRWLGIVKSYVEKK